MNIDVDVNINVNKHVAAVNNDDFWTFAAETWYKLYYPYVPMQSGNLANDVNITPGAIEHYMPYAKKMYFGEGFNFRKDKHPFSSSKWDKAALPTQGEKLTQSLQGYIDSGRMKL